MRGYPGTSERGSGGPWFGRAALVRMDAWTALLLPDSSAPVASDCVRRMSGCHPGSAGG